MSQAGRRKCLGSRRVGRRPRQGFSTEKGQAVNTFPGSGAERRGRLAGALRVRMSREIALARGRFPGTRDRALGEHYVGWQVDRRLMT